MAKNILQGEHADFAGVYIVMFFSAVTSTIAIRHLLYEHLEERIKKELLRVSGEFKNHTQQPNIKTNQSLIKDPATLFDTFKVYL
jgi:hypothetical protein